MTTTKRELAIVGGGIGGLTAALALQQAGFQVRVYEQAPQLAEVGAGISLSPTAVHGLNHLGLREVLLREAYAPEDQVVRHYQNARPLSDINRGRSLLERYGERYYLIHRADLHDALAAAVRANDPAAILLDHRFQSLEQHDDHVQLSFSNGKRYSATVVIGADGSRSVVREQLFGPGDPQFTGYIAWRGLVPMEKVPAGILKPPSGIFVGPRHLVNRYPVRRGTQLNFVAFAERTAWTEEGWSIHSTVQELLDEFAGWHEYVLTFMRETPPELLFKWGLFDREPLEQWTRERVTLLGDAAHPVLPFLGHGAVMAIEDGVVLARALAESARLEDGLQRYENARRERTTFIVLQSREAGKHFHHADPDSYGERSQGKPADERLGLFDYNPVTAPI
ncbi:MAG TPA: FAD-dependent monooxygenase [Steroidobacteraceae bacterium]|nr:FAD-dependent monooxygenase [Steroidobacteraceae bacterium]HRX88358.1 FAD-dependent monooxygenase [Steroidobacteraceae bacterium]